MSMRVRIIGAGRAGVSFGLALDSVGYETEIWDREKCSETSNTGGLGFAASGVDAILIAVPDDEVAGVSEKIAQGKGAAGMAVLHCAGALGLNVLEPHVRRGSIHPLMALPDPMTGAERLTNNGWFAVDGDHLAIQLAKDLGGSIMYVNDQNRALYHATAAVAANHLVALLGQVERLAGDLEIPVAPFFALARGAFNDVEEKGYVQALTGPASRGDIATVQSHIDAVGVEAPLYKALSDEITRIVAIRDAQGGSELGSETPPAAAASSTAAGQSSPVGSAVAQQPTE